MTTIKLKNGSGAPTAGDLVAGEPALDLTNKRLYTEDSVGTVIEVGTNPGTDVTFADNRKAIFGAGSDLQIYHDGDSSYISHNTTGTDLVVEATSPGDDVIVRAADDLNFRVNGNENGIVVVGGGATTLYNSNAAKLATTSTGIDVTGTVIADAVGIGTSSPSKLLHVKDTNATLNYIVADIGNSLISSGNGAGFAVYELGSKVASLSYERDGTGTFDYNAQSHVFNNNADTTEYMRIDASGNLLVSGTSTTPWSNGTGTASDNQLVAREDGILGASAYKATASSGYVGYFNRTATDGGILAFNKNGTTVGSIGSEGGDALYIQSGTTSGAGLHMHPTAGNINPARNGAKVDNAIDLGRSTHRFKDLYLSGGVYLGGTGTANKLDDYEEGTWTPAVTHVSGFSSATITSIDARYTKIGRQVTLEFLFRLDSSSGNVTVGDDIVLTSGSLPFTPSFNSHANGVWGIQSGMATGENVAMGYAGMSAGNLLGLIVHTVDGTVTRSTALGGVVTYFTNS